MNAKQIIKAIFAFLLFCFFQNAAAQNIKDEIPTWIKMMDDPDVNYYDAVEVFNNYWKGKERPTEENEIFREKKSKVKEYKDEKTLQYAFEYKKFLKWQRQMLPYVQENGRILTKVERLEIWEKEKRNRN